MAHERMHSNTPTQESTYVATENTAIQTKSEKTGGFLIIPALYAPWYCVTL